MALVERATEAPRNFILQNRSHISNAVNHQRACQAEAKIDVSTACGLGLWSFGLREIEAKWPLSAGVSISVFQRNERHEQVPHYNLRNLPEHEIRAKQNKKIWSAEPIKSFFVRAALRNNSAMLQISHTHQKATFEYTCSTSLRLSWGDDLLAA